MVQGRRCAMMLLAAANRGDQERSMSMEQGSIRAGAEQSINVGETERMISTLGGAGLAALGLARRGVGGVALMLLGGALVQRGLSGRCAMYRALDVDTAHP